MTVADFIGKELILVALPNGCHSSRYALTIGKAYKIEGAEGSNLVTRDDNGRFASFNCERFDLSLDK